MIKKGFSQPWWLEVGTEICPICHHLYIYETEHRCSSCDTGVCSDCIEPSTSTCPHCGSEVQEDSLDIELEV